LASYAAAAIAKERALKFTKQSEDFVKQSEEHGRGLHSSTFPVNLSHF
jgi:hypothetical protein